MTERVHLETVIAQLLNLPPKEVKQKLSPLKDVLVKLLSENKTISLKGVGELSPVLLEEGVFLDTNTNKHVHVGQRLSPRAKLQHRFKLAVKQQRLKNLNFY